MPRRSPLLLALLLWAAPSQAAPVPRHECFPVERLDPALREKAEAMLLKMLDSEALFTLVGGLKPISNAFWTYRYEASAPELGPLEERRKIMEVVRCGDAYYADVMVFARDFSGKKFADAFVAHRPSVARAIREHQAYFAPSGVTPEAHPLEVVLTVEHSAEPGRFRGYGYLFGYPDHAVEFFATSDEQQKAAGETKPTPRDFLSAPTFAHDKHKFVWAVPKGQEPNEADRAIIERASVILEAYRSRRELYIGEGKPGVVALLRDWFDDGTGMCSPDHASLEPISPAPAPAPAGAIAATYPAPAYAAPAAVPAYAAPAGEVRWVYPAPVQVRPAGTGLFGRRRWVAVQPTHP